MKEQLDSIRTRYERFAELECNEYSRLYAHLARTVATSELLLEFIAGMPDTQPNLFFAAIQYLNGSGGMPDGRPELESFVEKHDVGIAAIMRSRHTQTNEVGRCAVLLPALPPGPISLIEVGASAGLCLLLDKFYYDFGHAQVGNPRSSVSLSCAQIGPNRVPLTREVPLIVWRRGLDIDPVDLTDTDDARWLLACVWADQIERQERLKAAIDVWRHDRPQVVRGDLVDGLPRLLQEAPSGSTLVVYHSAVLPYVKPAKWEAFQDLLLDWSNERDIVWVSNEGPGLPSSVDELAPPREELRFRLGRTVFSKGQRKQQLLALAHYHGLDIEWLHA